MATCSAEGDGGEDAPRAVPRSKLNQNGGGYDCEFVTPQPDVVQTECPICLMIPKEPCVISCPCGKEFCRECIERIKKDNKPCPLCNLTDFTFLRHHGSERYLKAQEVWCSYKKEKGGCEWRGKLGEYEQHLNRNPSPENQLTGCQFVEVECEHGCGEWFQRRHITAHQRRLCSKRPYSCEFCCEYKSTFADVTKNHHHQCNKFPVTCPNKCREAPFERQKVENHVKVECPLTEVNCPLHYAGCEVRLPRKDMAEHMRDTVTHLTLLATVTQTLLKENQELKQCNQQLAVKQSTTAEAHSREQMAIEKEVETLKKEIKKLQQNIDEHKKENQELKQQLMSSTEAHYLEQKAMEALKKEVRENRQNIQDLRKENQEMQYQRLQSTTEGQYQATEKEVEALKKADRELRLMLGRFPIDFHVSYAIKEVQYLPSFYTHSHGYQMCIRVYTNGNGPGKGTDVSIYTHLMQGPYDDHLKWPFRGEITIQIVNQAGDHSHVEMTIPYNDKTPDGSAGRVIDKERSGGWGFDKFLAHTDLEYNAAKKTQYLKDDIIIVRVVRVKITH